MTRDDNGLQGLSVRIDTAGRRDNTIKSTLDRLDQMIERMSPKIDDRSLADSTYRSKHDRQSYQPSLIDHHHIDHHQDILYNILNLVNFSMRRNCDVLIINTMMIMKIEGCSMIGKGGWLILALVGEVDFQTLIGETGFLILFLLLMGVLMLSQPYFGSIKLMGCLIWSIFLWRIKSSSWSTNLKEEQLHGGINFKTFVCTKTSRL